MGNDIIFLGGGEVRKSLERWASKKFNNKCSESSRSEIVFRTDIFQKLSLGALVFLQNTCFTKVYSQFGENELNDVSFSKLNMWM